jgi:hypothetical protein
MFRIVGLTVLASASVAALAADAGGSPTTLAAVNAVSPATIQRVREEMHQMLMRLATSGALGAHPEQVALSIDEPEQRSINLGLLVDATNAANARDGLRVLGATPGSTAEQLGVRAGDVLVAVNGRSLRDLGADDRGRALAASTLRSDIESLPDGASLQLDIVRSGTHLALNGPIQAVSLPAVRLALGAAMPAASDQAANGSTNANACGRISVQDLAPRQQSLYGALLLTIDGNTPGPHTVKKFRVTPGVHELEVAERIPTSAMGMGEIAAMRSNTLKKLTVTVEPNTTVLVAARFNHDNATRLKDGAYWDPVAWKVVQESCP